MKIIAYTTDDVFSLLESEWNTLLSRSTTDTVFNTCEWHRSWWKSYRPGDLWILTVRDNDALVGIASFFIAKQEDKRVLHFVGCEDVTDYLDIIVDSEHVERTYEALADFLREQRAHFDLIDLCNIPESSLTHDLFANALRERGFEAEISPMEVCPIVRLDNGWEGYLESLDKKQRHEVRRKLRRVEPFQQDGRLRWYIVDDKHDLQVEMQKFLDLMAKSQQAKAQFLQEAEHIAFFNDVVPQLFKAGWVQMSFLVIDEQPVTAYLNFDYNNRILVYNSGLDASDYGYLSPGIVLLSYNIQHAIELGRDVFDFLRGDEIYKYRMGGQDTSIFNLKAQFNET